VPIGYGIKKMQITAVIEDAKVESMDAIIEGKFFPLFFPSQETSQKTHLFSPFVLSPPQKKHNKRQRSSSGTARATTSSRSTSCRSTSSRCCCGGGGCRPFLCIEIIREEGRERVGRERRREEGGGGGRNRKFLRSFSSLVSFFTCCSPCKQPFSIKKIRF